jgi:hypothetical protein
MASQDKPEDELRLADLKIGNATTRERVPLDRG